VTRQEKNLEKKGPKMVSSEASGVDHGLEDKGGKGRSNEKTLRLSQSVSRGFGGKKEPIRV